MGNIPGIAPPNPCHHEGYMLHSRDQRIAEAIRQCLTMLFSQEMSDPRLPDTVTIIAVEMSKDMKQARVHYSQMPDDARSRERMEELLEDAQGYLRSQVAEDLNMKYTPSLVFRYDVSAAHSERVNELLHKIQQEREAREKAGGAES